MAGRFADPLFDAEMARPISLGTTIIGVTYDGGVVLGADSRTSSGNYIANRTQDKITPLSDSVYMCRSGSASDTQAIATYVQYYIAQHQAEKNGQVDVATASNLIMQMAYNNKNNLQAGMIVGGWDTVEVRGVFITWGKWLRGALCWRRLLAPAPRCMGMHAATSCRTALDARQPHSASNPQPHQASQHSQCMQGPPPPHTQTTHSSPHPPAPPQGGAIYAIPLGGTLLKVPYAIGGSGSAYITGFCDKHYRTGMSEQEARQVGSSCGLGLEWRCDGLQPEARRQFWTCIAAPALPQHYRCSSRPLQASKALCPDPRPAPRPHPARPIPCAASSPIVWEQAPPPPR